MIRIIVLTILVTNSYYSFSQCFNNYDRLDLNNENLNFKILESKLKDYELIVFGEEHFKESNIYIQYELFKFLYYELQFRHILIEYGASRGLLINLYLKTGDKDILLRLGQEKINYNFYIMLKSFYDLLPDNQKFNVHGIDYEKDGLGRIKYCIYKVIDYNLKNKKVLSEASTEFMKVYDELGEDDISKKKIEDFLFEIKSDSLKYKEEYGEYYNDLVILYNAINIDLYEVKYKENIIHPLRELRENLISNQVLELKERYLNEKFYCIFGTLHISLKPHDNWANLIEFNSFVSKLNTNDTSPFKSKVFSILTLYESCIPSWKKNYFKKRIGLNREQLKELDEKSKDNVYTLFECPNETKEQKKYWQGYYQMILVNRFK